MDISNDDTRKSRKSLLLSILEHLYTHHIVRFQYCRCFRLYRPVSSFSSLGLSNGNVMYPVTKSFLNALESEKLQHLRGTVTDITGAVTELNDTNLLGAPRYDKQCVENPEVFNFGEMYVGTAEVTIHMPGVLTNRFRGGELRLEFGVDISESEIEWIPLGVWDITEPKRETGDRIVLKCCDKMNRLQVRCGSNATGIIRLKNVMELVSQKAGVEFAQTSAEIAELAEEEEYILYKISFCETCWEEVRMISQLIGGFAFANREGKIEFRKFKDVNYSIPAEKRKDISLSEYGFHVKGVSYTDKYGLTYSTGISRIGVGSVLSFSDNGYIPSVDKETDMFCIDRIERINDDFRLLMWTPGTVSFYGNPAIDVGDIIRITGGINGKGNVGFLIGTDSWQFRSPQTIISPGAIENGTASSSGGGSSGTGIVSVNNFSVTKSLNTVVLEKNPGDLYEGERTAAEGGFSCKSATGCFLCFTGVFLAERNCTAAVKVYLDGAAQEMTAKQNLHAGEFSTVSFTFPLTASAGTHTVSITASGLAGLQEISAFVSGQDITEKAPQYTSADDYRYTVNNGISTVTAYLGTSMHPEIPDILGGGAATIIDKTAFTESEITGVWIPEGVTEIQ